MFAYTVKQTPWLMLISLFVVLCTPLTVRAATAPEIDAQVNRALTKFRNEVPGAAEYLEAAKGVLVIPDVKKFGLVIAAQWGTGALRVGSSNVGYYRMEAGSAGFQAGYQKADFVFIFFTKEALDKFRSSKGWTVGAEAGITFVEAGTGVAADTLKNKSAVAGFAFGKEGLMAGWSAKGTKFTPIEPDR